MKTCTYTNRVVNTSRRVNIFDRYIDTFHSHFSSRLSPEDTNAAFCFADVSPPCSDACPCRQALTLSPPQVSDPTLAPEEFIMTLVPPVTMILAYAVGGIGLLVASLGFLKSGGGEGGVTPSFNGSDLIVDADHLQEQVRYVCTSKLNVIGRGQGYDVTHVCTFF